MKERPILFSTPMVQAILAGNKTQTRRIVKPQPGEGYLKWYECSDGGQSWTRNVFQGEKGDPFTLFCPYGQPGDRLWVRETWSPTYTGCAAPYLYRADYRNGVSLLDIGGDSKNWRPSIFMPRAASRITLEITDVRVERLRDISEEDAEAEGISYEAACDHWYDCPQYAMAYADLWDSINGKTHPWLSAPWVWVLTFKQI